jgi:hypothetical protein
MKFFLIISSAPFQDKYSQIYRILLPICNALSQIHSLVANPALRSYIDNEFGSTDKLIREILADFFRHGFDGSGADSYMDAGSCIDGVSMHSSRYHYSANQFLDHRG